MDNQVASTEPPSGSPVLVIVEPLTLARSCIISIVARELTGYEIAGMPTTDDLSCVSERNIRLVVLSVGHKSLADPTVENDLMLVVDICGDVPIALLSARDDEAIALAALHRGVRGFFPVSISVDVAIAGLRLVLAGGIYMPLPIIGRNGISGPKQLHPSESLSGSLTPATAKNAEGLTPREQQVLAALALGLPNKLIGARLNLSENTVKMHIQHIMRKCSARNRTEVVLRWNAGLLGRHSDDSDGPTGSSFS